MCPAVKDAILKQQQIGIRFMIRGYLTTAWREVLRISGVSHPERRMVTLQQMMWETIVEPLWAIQNDNLHRQKSHFDSVEEENMAELLVWYVQNKHNILSSQDRFLAQFDVTTICRMYGCGWGWGEVSMTGDGDG